MRFSLSSRPINPVITGLWFALWIWTALTAVIWLAGPGSAENWAHRMFAPSGEEVAGVMNSRQKFAEGFLALVDPIWMILAAANCYLHVAASVGLATVRRWSLLIFAGSFLTAAALAWSSDLTYTARLGPRLGPVPLGLPMLWCVILLGGREAVRSFRPLASHAEVAAGTALLAAATVLNLDTVARSSRFWWLWRSGATPWWFYAAWIVLAAVLGWQFRGSTQGRANAGRPPWRVAAIFGAFHAMALLAHLSR